MKEISERERDLILALVGEGRTQLPEGVLEKDLVVTAGLRRLKEFHDPAKLFFCGGTCLSKAHRVVRRMSEDLDFKIQLSPSLTPSKMRRDLSLLKNNLAEHLREGGFDLPQEGVKSRNNNKKICMRLVYRSRFPAVVSLRSELQVQLVAAAPRLSTMELPIDSLVGEMSGTEENRAIWSCLGLEETFIEKIVAFLRRSLRGTRGKIEEMPFDLVRHLYDVVMIQRLHNIGQNRNLTVLFREVVQADAREFANQDAEFARDPMKALRKAWRHLQEDPEKVLEVGYQQFARDMVYGEVPAFAEARGVFGAVAKQLLDSALANGGSW